MDKWMIRYLIIIGAMLIALFALKYVYIYFTPFIIAAILASLINPIVNYLNDKIPIHRGFIVIFVLLFLVTILVVFVIVGFSQGYLELNRLLRNLPDYKTLGNQLQWILQQNNQFNELLNNLEISEGVRTSINSNLQMIYDTIRNSLVNLINTVLGFIGMLPMIITILFLSFIATFFISRDANKIKDFMVDLFPEETHLKINKVMNQLNKSAVGYIRALIILISITGVITGIGLSILGNQYALIIAISAALLDLIPIIGPALVFYPWIIFSFLSGNISFGVALLILHLILAAVRSGSEGKIMGESLGLHPLATMISLYAGFRILGGLGILVGPSLLVVVKAIADSQLIVFKE